MDPNPYRTPAAKVDAVDAAAADSAGPRGFGGWLILPMLGLIITPFRMLFQFVQELLPIFTGPAWHTVTTPGTGAYHPMWAPLLLFELIGNTALFAFTLVVLVQFFRKSRLLPKLYIIWLLSLVVVQGADWILGAQIPTVAEQNDFKELFRAIVGAAIWIPYFSVSKRVRNTFVS
jgi:hypothetical protein